MTENFVRYTGKLRPPTDKEMCAGEVPLKQLWLPIGEEDVPDNWREGPYAPTLVELYAFMATYEIPHSARIEYLECGSHTVSLEWDV